MRVWCSNRVDANCVFLLWIVWDSQSVRTMKYHEGIRTSLWSLDCLYWFQGDRSTAGRASLTVKGRERVCLSACLNRKMLWLLSGQHRHNQVWQFSLLTLVLSTVASRLQAVSAQSCDWFPLWLALNAPSAWALMLVLWENKLLVLGHFIMHLSLLFLSFGFAQLLKSWLSILNMSGRWPGPCSPGRGGGTKSTGDLTYSFSLQAIWRLHLILYRRLVLYLFASLPVNNINTCQIFKECTCYINHLVAPSTANWLEPLGTGPMPCMYVWSGRQ